MKQTSLIPAVLAVTVLAAGCATNVKKPESTQNPAPTEAFSRFSSFELKRINTTEGCDKQRGADVALREIQTRLDNRMAPVISVWNAAGAKTTKPRALIIEPICSDAKLVGTGARIWGGALAGSSAVVLKVRYIDAATGKNIAEPVFYQRANAMGAAYSFGATDRDMLNRIVDLIANYTTTNYTTAVGGPTGL